MREKRERQTDRTHSVWHRAPENKTTMFKIFFAASPPLYAVLFSDGAVSVSVTQCVFSLLPSPHH